MNPPFGGGPEVRGVTPPVSRDADPRAIEEEPPPDPVAQGEDAKTGALTGVGGGGPFGKDDFANAGASLPESSISSLEGGDRPARVRRPIGGVREDTLSPLRFGVSTGDKRH